MKEKESAESRGGVGACLLYEMKGGTFTNHALTFHWPS
jgi:hypothetical protein